MKKIYIKSEMYKIIDALDFYSRIWIGQLDAILRDIRWYRNCRQLDALEPEFTHILIRMRNALFPELQSYGLYYVSYGIFSDKINYKAAVAYDMQQEFRYKMAYFLKPEGGISVDFHPPMHADLDPYPAPIGNCYEKDGEIYEEIEVCDEQYEIIQNALKIRELMYAGKFVEMFTYYTDNEYVLELADKFAELMADVEVER